VLDSDATDLENDLERLSGQDGSDLFAERVDRDALNVEVHIVGIPGALEKKPQVASAFQGPGLFVQFPADLVEQDQVKNLHGLLGIQ
jgi:hypothetical protein